MPAKTRKTEKRSFSDFFLEMFTWLLGLGDVIFNPLQRLIGLKRMAWVFLLPNLVIFGIFILLPMLLNFAYSFTSGNEMLLENRAVVGMDNLDRLFSCENYGLPNTCREDLFWRAASNTLVFVLGQVIFMVLLSLITALALNRSVPWRGFFRAMFFYPVLLSPVVVALIWRWILQDQYGLLNSVLVSLGMPKVGWLIQANWAQFWVIAVSIWAQMGFFTLILLAGLQSISKEVYEASAMDGANPWQSFTQITWPLLLPTTTVVVILALIRAVQVFDQVFVLTGGGPGTATLYLVQYIYRSAFDFRNYGLAAAASLVMAVVLLVLTLGQLYFSRKQEAA